MAGCKSMTSFVIPPSSRARDSEDVNATSLLNGRPTTNIIGLITYGYLALATCADNVC